MNKRQRKKQDKKIQVLLEQSLVNYIPAIKTLFGLDKGEK